MAHKTEVTGLGIAVEGVTILPGSTLITKAKPPSHWQRFSQYKGGDNSKIATPNKGQQVDVATPNEEEQLKQAQERYEELTGSKPGNKKLSTLQKEIESAEALQAARERYQELFEEEPAEDVTLEDLQKEIDSAEQK